MKGDNLRSLSIIFLLIITSLLVTLATPEDLSPVHFVGTLNASFAGGDGTLGDPYQISNVSQLQEMETELEAHYILINDIDASDTSNWNSGEGFEPIGNGSTPFSGLLYGGSYNISDLFINTPSKDHLGIFGSISDGSTLSNINSINTDISGYNYVGGLVGRREGGEVNNCTISGDVHGNNKVGGLIGHNSGEVENCHTTCEVNASNDVGGLIGDNYLGNITYCSASGDIVGDHNWIGGLIGWNNLLGNISFCYAAGDAGGNESGWSRGGLVGYNDGGTIFSSFATGNASGSDTIGGLVGQNEYDGSIVNCYALGNVGHGFTAGGLVGTNKGTISNSYSTGMLDPTSISGLVGYGSSRVYNSFWNIETSRANRSYGGTGLNDSEMRTGSIFRYAGWNMIDLWGIIDGRSYPFLKWYEYPGVPEIWNYQTSWNVMEDIPFSVDYYAKSSLPGGWGAIWGIETNAGNWLSMDVYGVLSGTPANEDVGTYWVDVTASLFDQGVDHINFTLNVLNRNDDPIIETSSLPDAKEDEMYRYEVEVSDIDPESTIFLYRTDSNARFLTINPGGRLEGLPSNEDVGDWWVYVNISDGSGGSDELNLTLTVLNTNDDPEILPFDIPDIFEDEYFSLDLEAEDIDPTGDILSWSMMTEASFLILDPENGTITGLPRNEDVGIWGVTAEVYDGRGGSDLIFFSLEVMNINDDPLIITNSLPDGLEDELYSFTLQGYDVDPTLDPLLFQIMETNTDFLNIDPVDNILNGLPENEDVGTWWVNITVSDGNGGYDWRNFTLTILGINDRPMLNVSELIITIDEDSAGYEVNLDDIFIDEEGDPLSFDHFYEDHISATIKGNELTLVPESNWFGQTWFWISASDGVSKSYINATVIVTSVNDAPYHAEIFSKPAYAEGGNQTVYASASDVDLPFGDELTYIWTSNITGHIGNGRSINLSLPAGVHLITVTVSDIEGLSINASMIIEIAPIEKEDGKDKMDLEKVIGFFVIGFLIGLVFIFILLRRKKKYGSLTEVEADEVMDELLEEILEE